MDKLAMGSRDHVRCRSENCCRNANIRENVIDSISYKEYIKCKKKKNI